MGKHTMILDLLTLLQRESDESHILTMDHIKKALNGQDPSRTIDRRSVYSMINDLIDYGYDISTYRPRDEATPSNGKGYYLMNRDFEDSELRFLIDSVSTSKSIPIKQRQALINKLLNLGSRTLQGFKPDYLFSLENQPVNKELFLNIELLTAAINDGLQVSFISTNYDVNKHLVPNNKGKSYTVNPYKIVIHNQKYYLICLYQGREQLTHIRLDRMTKVQVQKTRVKPFCDDLRAYLEKHPYMYAGEITKADLKIDKSIIGDVLETFGTAITLYEIDGETARVRVNASKQALKYWVIQYGTKCEVVWPQTLRTEVKDMLDLMLAKYQVPNPTK